MGGGSVGAPGTGIGRGGGGTTGGGGVAGQPPYVPGESVLLPWRKDATLFDALHREQGAVQPILIFLYSSSMADDCCAANFERAVFRTEDTVKAFSQWACYKVEMSTVTDSKDLEPFQLRSDKPALLLLDAEGGLLHKQQLCVDPAKFLRVIESAKRLSDLRFRLKDRHLAKRREAQERIEAGEYDQALRLLDDLLGEKDKLSGQVLTLVEADRSQLAATARGKLDEAERLRQENQLLDSYRLYKEIEKEFSRLEDLGREAGEHRRDVGSTLRKMGVRIR